MDRGMVLGNIQCRSALLIWMRVGQRPWECLFIPPSLSLSERRLKRLIVTLREQRYDVIGYSGPVFSPSVIYWMNPFVILFLDRGCRV